MAKKVVDKHRAAFVAKHDKAKKAWKLAELNAKKANSALVKADMIADRAAEVEYSAWTDLQMYDQHLGELEHETAKKAKAPKAKTKPKTKAKAPRKAK